MKRWTPSASMVFLLAIVPCVALSETNIWQGKSARNPTAWDASENWSASVPPAQDDGNDVVIPGGIASYPKLSEDVVIGGSLTVETGATLTLAGHHVSLGALPSDNKKGVTIKGTLNAEVGASIITVGRGGFVNTGKVLGLPALVFESHCVGAVLTAGGAQFSSLTLGMGDRSYPVTLTDTATVARDLVLNGNNLVIAKDAALTVKGNLVFSGTGERTVALTLHGSVILHGDLLCNHSAVCGGAGEGWVILSGSGDQTLRVGSRQAILPPLKVAKPSGKVVVTESFSCAGLLIEKGNFLDLSAVKSLQFGGAQNVSGACRGLINHGKIKGTPELVFSSGCYWAVLVPGETAFSGLSVDTGNGAYKVTLDGNLVVGDLNLKCGSFLTGTNRLSIGKSCIVAPFTTASDSGYVRFEMGATGTMVFDTAAPAVFDPGGSVSAVSGYSTQFQNIVIDKPGGAVQLKSHVLVVNGTLKVKAGGLQPVDGGEIWMGVVRQDQKVVDVALKITDAVTPENAHEVVATQVSGEAVAGAPPARPFVIEHPAMGPAIPPSVTLSNMARFAAIRGIPYTTMVRALVDPDEKLRTKAQPEGGTPAKGTRYEFRYDRPLSIAQIRWANADGPWALLADTHGDGRYDRLLRLEMEGKLTNPGGIWMGRAWAINNVWPPVKAYGIQLVNPTGPLDIYDLQILCPVTEIEAAAVPVPGKDVPELKDGDPFAVPEPALEKQFLKGFHIEPWIFCVNQWITMDKAKRPPLTEYDPFKNFVAQVKKYHANTLCMWPLKTFGEARGKGTYETDLLWPSRYDQWSIQENVLRAITDAFHTNNITLFTMERCVYPKKLEEFPKTDTRDKPAPYISRAGREFLKGFVQEQVASGVDGVGIGYDEELGALLDPAKADHLTKDAFRARYKVAAPERVEDTEAYRRWLVFGYEEFASYLAEAATAAKAANPRVLTKTPTHMCLGSMWNRRIDFNIAEDIVAHTADLDFIRAYGYQDNADLGHYVAASVTTRMVAANRGKGPDSLHNAPWAPNAVSYPGYYLEWHPAYTYGPPISSVMHGGRLPLYWRYDHIVYGGCEKYVEQAFSILDTLAAWGAKEAQIPRQIVVLTSRASEDWWQVRQRYNPAGNPMDQTRGFLYEKWLMEVLLANGYPFRMYYLDQPDDFARELSQSDLIILPFPYSVSQKAFQVIESAAKKGSRLLLFDRQGETDEWGNPHARPVFADLIASGKATFVGEDMTSVGQDPSVQRKTCETVDRLLGRNKPTYFNPHGNDVELACLEKGAREKFLCFINWTDRKVEVDAGVSLPSGTYQVFQRDLAGAKKTVLNGKETAGAADLGKFRVGLTPWEIKVLYVHPSGK